MENNFKAVLFDFDGVLAETMEDLYLAWERAFLDFGVQIKKEDYFPIEGTTEKDYMIIGDFAVYTPYIPLYTTQLPEKKQYE